MKQKVLAVLTEDRFGYRKNKGTKEAILSQKSIMEKRMERSVET